MGITIRAARPDDFAAVLKLLRQLWPSMTLNEPALALAYDRALQAPTKRYCCAVYDAEVIGFLSLDIRQSLWQAGPLAHVDELVVDERHRGRGVGTALLEHATTVARELGCRRVELDSAFHRTEAHALYERTGFEKRAFLFSKPM